MDFLILDPLASDTLVLDPSAGDVLVLDVTISGVETTQLDAKFCWDLPVVAEFSSHAAIKLRGSVATVMDGVVALQSALDINVDVSPREIVR